MRRYSAFLYYYANLMRPAASTRFPSAAGCAALAFIAAIAGTVSPPSPGAAIACFPAPATIAASTLRIKGTLDFRAGEDQGDVAAIAAIAATTTIAPSAAIAAIAAIAPSAAIAATTTIAATTRHRRRDRPRPPSPPWLMIFTGGPSKGRMK